MAQKKLGGWHAKTHHETHPTTTSPTTTRQQPPTQPATTSGRKTIPTPIIDRFAE
jgi:hypothetical protein